MRSVVYLLATALLVLTSSQAAALSCVPYDYRRDYWRNADAAETYLLVYGKFSELRDPWHDTAHDQVIWQATFTGMAASTQGFDQPLTLEVTIAAELSSGIEGGPRPMDWLLEDLPGVEGLVFLQETLGGYVTTVGPCRPPIRTYPGSIADALDCLNGRNCPRPNERG